MNLYAENEISRFERKAKNCTILAAIIGIAVLAACLWLCALTDQFNGERMSYYVIGIFIIGGWIEIYLWLDLILVYRREAAHTRLILDSDKAEYEGIVEIRPERFDIPQSITIRKVFLRQGDSLEKLNIDVRREKQILELDGKSAKLTASHGYIIAWEVTEE